MNTLFSISNLIRKPFLFSTPGHKKPGFRPVKEHFPRKKKLELSDMFESLDDYEIIRQILIEQGFITSDSTAWIDFQNSYKKLIIVILKKLQVQGYYHFGKHIQATEIQEISRNTFGIEIGIDHIKHIGYNALFTDYIPSAASLEKKKEISTK